MTQTTPPASSLAITPLSRSLPSLEQFDCEGDQASVGVRWERWKSGLEIYLSASRIEDTKIKRATLLHIGGLALQEIYYNIPGAHIEESKDEDGCKIGLTN